MGVLGSFGDEGVVGLQFECPTATRDPALAEKEVIRWSEWQGRWSIFDFASKKKSVNYFVRRKLALSQKWSPKKV